MLTKHSVCLVSIARLGPLYIISTNTDVSKHDGGAAVLSSMEVNVGIICASLPSLRAITIRTCSRRNTHRRSMSARHSHPGWWRFGKNNDNIDPEAGPKQEMSNSGSAITKIVSITQDRKDARKVSQWSLGGGGGIFDGGAGASRAYIRSDVQ